MKKRYLCLLSLFILFLLVSVSWAEKIDLYSSYLFRTVRGPNTVNYSEGDWLLLGGYVTPFYSTTQVTASYDHDGIPLISGSLPYIGGGYWPASEEYGVRGPYNPAYTDSWLLTATNGTNSDSLYTHSLGDVDKVPFVRNVRLTGSGLTPTVSWEVPPSSGADRVVMTVLASNGFRLWESPSLSPDTNNYTIPEGKLSPNTPYTVRVKLEATSINIGTISRTETFVNFTPLAAGDPNTVFLPVVGPDTNPNDNLGAAFQFDFDVTQGEPVFIDPFVAIGYDYRIGENNPLFASVTLPVLGDNKYDLYYLLPTGEYQYKSQILGGEQYFFEGGIDFFRILGIEETLGIDPNNVTAFITELTFMTTGIFTGSMTPILSEVSVPATTTLYFPHVATSNPWQTEIAIINTSAQTVTGTLRALSNGGQLIETKDVTLPARGRKQIIVSNEFTNHTNIGYMIFDTNSAAVQGYTKFYTEGVYRAAIPAVKEVNTSDIYISHIASSADWWTGVSLVNTTSATKALTITFNSGQSVPYTLNANEHKAFLIDSLFNNQPQPDIKSAVITNASGIIGLELFGSTGGGNQLDGVLLADDTASTIYYPHVASDNVWWTGIVAYNPSALACNITITPYSAAGTPLTPATRSIAGKEKYIGLVSGLGLPAETAWFKIDSTSPLAGFELFATVDGNQLAAYAGSGAKTGIFAKIEKNGWTGIAFVNTEASTASVTLTAYNDNGTAVATQVLPVGGYAKVVNMAETIFSQNISTATYITYSSDRNVVGFQLNGSSDGMMLDGLPALSGGN